jgi:two-component system cell cycle response regulator
VRLRKRGERINAIGALRLAIGATLFAGALLVALHDWLGLGGSGLDSYVNGPLYDAVLVAAGIACLLKAASSPDERGAWRAIAAAMLSWAAAEVYWTAVIVPDPAAPYPSPADLGYLAFFPLAATGIFLLIRARARELDWRLWVDGLIAALGTAALGSAFVFSFVADHAEGTTVQVATTLAYPLGDILMLSLVVGVVALTRWRPGRTWSLLLAGLAALVLADVAYTLQSTEATLPGGSWIEPVYLLGAAFIGAEAWQRDAEAIRPAARFDGWRELMVPGFFAAVMIGLSILQHVRAASGLATALWAATMVAVIARLGLSIRENKQLLDQVKTDPLTELGNQGRMQVDLASRCAWAAQEPVTLLLFDLDGFKRYNDTFGHPAGDVLLNQLGKRLKAAVGENGDAYRIGGDEFGVILVCEPEHLEALTKRAAEALSARGRGAEVSASWGAARIPAEADTPAAALQLADVRMYAQKESRRASRDNATALSGPAEVSVTASASRDGEAFDQGQQHGGDFGAAGRVV